MHFFKKLHKILLILLESIHNNKQPLQHIYIILFFELKILKSIIFIIFIIFWN